MYKQIEVTELDKIADALNAEKGWEFVAFIPGVSPIVGWLLLRKR